MTEWFGVGVESTRRSTGEKVLVNVILRDSYEEAVKDVGDGKADERGNRLVLLRVQEVDGAMTVKPLDAPTLPPRGTVNGKPCTCTCHSEPGIMHIMACCHAPYFD